MWPSYQRWLERKEQRARLREQFGPLYASLLQILFTHDPVRINYGANPDEYEPEVDTILPRLVDASSQDEVLDIIHEEFAAWFSAGIAGPKQRYEQVAFEVWRAWKEWKEQRSL
jgi:hypothetical protein